MNANFNAMDAFLENTYYERSSTTSKEEGVTEATDLNNTTSPSTEATQTSEPTQTSAASETTLPTEINNTRNTPVTDSTPTTQNPEDSVFYKAAKSASRGKLSWKKVTQGGITGIVLGTAAVLLWPDDVKGADSADVTDASSDEDGTGDDLVSTLDHDTVDEIGSEPVETYTESSLASLVDPDVPWAHGVNDEMTYAEAFTAARSEVGPGGVFEWRGQLYGTYYGNEWDDMSTAERDEFNHHFSWTHETTHEPDLAHDDILLEDDEISIIADPDLAMTDPSEEEIEPLIENEDVEIEPLYEAVEEELEPLSGAGVELEEEIDLLPDDDDEVEILGITHDDDTGMTYGSMSVDGQDFLLIDVEDDGTFDYAISDLNHNDIIDEDEIFDISSLDPDADDGEIWNSGIEDGSLYSYDDDGFIEDDFFDEPIV